MTTQIGINGFGRIGRDYLRSVLASTDLEVVAINDVTDSATMARLLRYDSTFGPLRREVEDLGDAIVVDGHKIAVTAERDPAQLPGATTASTSSSSRPASSAPARAPARTWPPAPARSSSPRPARASTRRSSWASTTRRTTRPRTTSISNASCTTNCVAPMVKVLRRRVRHRAGLHDHGARLHQRPERARRSAQGPAPGPVGRSQHHPDHDRRRPRGRRGDPADEGPARRRRAARAGRRRLAGRPRRPCSTGT